MVTDMLTDHLPRIPLAHLPTPIEELKRLRAALVPAPRILIKRDDQTGLATGGNKTRKLEFVVADALAHDADTLVTTGGAQSNHCRQTAAAAAKVGLRCVLVLTGHPPPRLAWEGNLLLDDVLGAELRWAGDRDRDVALTEEVDALRAQGAKPYLIPLGASVPIGAAGYVAAVEELADQLTARGERVHRIVFASASGGTHAGMLVGVKGLGLDIRVEGMNNFAIGNDLPEKLRTLTAATAAGLKLNLTFSDRDFILHEACGPHGYGVITDAERNAVRLMARTEGIITDPVYTGRALGGLIDLVRQGVYRPDETVLFWHTGGVAGLFPRAADMLV
jgi:D-cysteine desulfhydrase family pyridoxal phosphate-dependent enzyme